MTRFRRWAIPLGILVGLVGLMAKCNSPNVWPRSQFGVSFPPGAKILRADRTNDFDFYFDGHAEAEIEFAEKFRASFIASLPKPGVKCKARGCSTETDSEGTLHIGFEPPATDDSCYATISPPNPEGVVRVHLVSYRD